MRHKVAGYKLGRTTSHRRAMLRNMVTSIIMEERIETTVIKAKAVRPSVEKMITLGKKGDLAARRQAASYLMTSEAVTKLFDTVAPRFGDRNGRLYAHRSHRMAQGRRRRKSIHRTAGQRAGDRRKAPEARRNPRQTRRRKPQGDGTRRRRSPSRRRTWLRMRPRVRRKVATRKSSSPSHIQNNQNSLQASEDGRPLCDGLS